MSPAGLRGPMRILGLLIAVYFVATPSTWADDSKTSAPKTEKGDAPAVSKPTDKLAPRTKIVLIGTKPDHPYATHMYLHECRLLATCLNQTPGVETVVVQDWPDERTLNESKAFVFYSSPAGDIVFDPKHKEAFQKRMADGAGYVAIHWSTAAGRKTQGPDYLNLLGGWYHVSHASQVVQTQELQQVNPKHPICSGWQNYKLREEFYFNLKYDPKAQPLVRVAVKHPSVTEPQVVAWTFDRPGSKGGRSFGTTLGHFHENFGITSFRKLIVNGILWSAHVDIPAEGAPVSVSTNDLDLPPPSAPGTSKK